MPSPDEYRSLDLEGAAQSGVARSSNVLGNTALIGVPLAALAFVGWLLYSWQHKDAKLMTAADKEEFNTQQYPGPGLPAERPSLDLGKMVVPPPPPPPAEPQVPPPPVAPPTALAAPPFPDAATQRSDDDEKRRLAEEERKKWERLRAGQLIADGGSTLSVNGAARRRAERTVLAPAPWPKRTAIAAFWRQPARRGLKRPWRQRMTALTRSLRRAR